VNSTGVMPKDKVVEQSRQLVTSAGLAQRVPVLVDHDGAVGHAYGARTTPHVFVIDGKGILRYAGAYTNDPRGRDKDATNYVVNALTQIAVGDTVSPDQTDPWGCGVKYAK
jgi:alkyl hydroperoxide reductase subunit AhpC